MNALQISGMPIILWASQQILSANSTPFINCLFFEENRQLPPHAASTCSQIDSLCAISAISSTGSKAPRTVVPEVAMMQKGTKPLARLRAISSFSEEDFILPFSSQATLITF